MGMTWFFYIYYFFLCVLCAFAVKIFCFLSALCGEHLVNALPSRLIAPEVLVQLDLQAHRQAILQYPVGQFGGILLAVHG